MPTNYNSAAERNKNALLTSGYDEIARSLFSDELSMVGNYELGAVIGKGSFGKVYIAHHTMTKTKVVIKAAEKFETEGLAREIYHHRRLRHPHITKLYEVIHTERHVWLVLEYCPGGELYEYLVKHKRLKETDAQRMFAQLCGAVTYIHKAGCVHRDLKLENILLDKAENVKLGDFGFTREYEPKKMLETWCGTYSYAAPEMIQGQKYSGEAVDVWSMGVILYALLCGELPFDKDDDEVRTKERIIKREFTLPGHLSADAKSLISSLLGKPDDRPTLAKILVHPFLSHHSSRQVHILAHNLVIPFAAPLEKRLLDRFEKAHIDTRALIQQMSEGGSGSLIGLWELSLDRARKLEESKKRKKKRRASMDVEIIESPRKILVDVDMISTPTEMTPVDKRFVQEFSLPQPPTLPDERPRSRGSRASRSSRRERPPSRSRSRSPSKGFTYRRPASPHKKSKERGFFHALRSLLSDWSQRQTQKLSHKKSKAALTNGDGINAKDIKNPLEVPRSGDATSKEELRRNRKGMLPNISIHPPPNRHLEENTDTESPLPHDGNDEYESAESAAGRRMSRHNRPSYRRRSTSSSINSLHSHHRYSHSKTSSTSSAGSGSVTTPRHNKSNLKVVPATPPPHLLTHEGAKGAGTLWGEGIVIARRRRSPFKGPPVGFMAGVGKRKGQGKQNGKWPEGAIKEEDEEVLDGIGDEGDLEIDGEGDDVGRDSYEAEEIDSMRQGLSDGRSTSASV